MKKVITILMISSLLALVVACNSNPTKEDFSTKEETSETPAVTTENGNPSYDPKRGEGKFTKVDIGATRLEWCNYTSNSGMDYEFHHQYRCND